MASAGYARTLGQAGAKVAIVDINPKVADERVTCQGAGTDAITVVADITQPASACAW